MRRNMWKPNVKVKISVTFNVKWDICKTYGQMGWNPWNWRANGMNSLELKDKRYEISRSTVNGIKYVEFQCKLNEICSTQRKMKNSYIILLPNVERKYHLGFYVIIEKISVIMIE